MKKELNTTNIYVITHKKYKMPESNIYYPLQVGREGKEDLGYLYDNKGENISTRNFTFWEITGMYWIWKNVKCNIVGLVHYRRLFYPSHLIFSYKNYLKEKDIEKILNKYDIIIPEKGYTFPNTDIGEYSKVHDVSEMLKCREIIEKKYP